MFDHTFLAASDDPHLETFKKLEKEGVIQLRSFENIGMEGTAQYVFDEVDKMIRRQTNNRAWVKLAEVRENEKNSAIYKPSLY
mgnify:FL=1